MENPRLTSLLKIKRFLNDDDVIVLNAMKRLRRKKRRCYERREKNRVRNRNYAIQEMVNMSDLEFRQHYQMGREAFNQLLSDILPFSENFSKR